MRDMELLTGVLLGTLIGLFVRPALDSWLRWRTIQAYRREAEGEHHETGPGRIVITKGEASLRVLDGNAEGIRERYEGLGG
jgi:hypothetical protein